MDTRKIRITIDSKGMYKFEAMEGFTGASCTNETKSIELVLGGKAVARGKKDNYYDGDSPSNLFLSL